MSVTETPNDIAAIADNLRRVRERIANAAIKAGRRPEDVTLVAVSKTKPVEAVRAALAAGQTVFGENRVQEAATKFPQLRAEHRFQLHIIGGLQTNKARDAVRLADVIETLDRPRLADAIAAAMAKEGRTPTLLIEVNTGDEAQKSGVARADADGFIDECKARFGAALVGLMCVPPLDQDPRPHFEWLADRAARHGLGVLSMGMSADFEIAIACGATWVRVGSAIFGHAEAAELAHGEVAARSPAPATRTRPGPPRRTARARGLSRSSTPSSTSPLQQRHHQLGTRRRVAGDMAGKRLDVRHEHRAALRRRGAAYALAERDADAGRRPWNGPSTSSRRAGNRTPPSSARAAHDRSPPPRWRRWRPIRLAGQQRIKSRAPVRRKAGLVRLRAGPRSTARVGLGRASLGVPGGGGIQCYRHPGRARRQCAAARASLPAR